VALEKSNLMSLRAIQHKDQFGNIISTTGPLRRDLRFVS